MKKKKQITKIGVENTFNVYDTYTELKSLRKKKFWILNKTVNLTISRQEGTRALKKKTIVAEIELRAVSYSNSNSCRTRCWDSHLRRSDNVIVLGEFSSKSKLRVRVSWKRRKRWKAEESVDDVTRYKAARACNTDGDAIRPFRNLPDLTRKWSTRTARAAAHYTRFVVRNVPRACPPQNAKKNIRRVIRRITYFTECRLRTKTTETGVCVMNEAVFPGHWNCIPGRFEINTSKVITRTSWMCKNLGRVTTKKTVTSMRTFSITRIVFGKSMVNSLVWVGHSFGWDTGLDGIIVQRLH